ncbi:MAG: YfhO family protein [bacterium]|nr:YfhO family protein [bacterium]MDZ4285085.1 YfhO family protein [Patescibacteria group bacterium]
MSALFKTVRLVSAAVQKAAFGRFWFLFLVIPVFIARAPLLVGGRILWWNDVVKLTAPYFSFLHRALASGTSYLWSAETLFGFPIFATSSGFFLPWFHLIALLSSTPERALYYTNVYGFIVCVLAAISCAALARALGVSKSAALMAGVAYIVTFRIIVPTAVHAQLFLPLLFLVLWKLAAKRWSYVLFGIALIAFGGLGVIFMQFVYFLAAAALFVLFIAWHLYQRGGARELRGFLLRVALMFGVGFAVASYQLLPTALISAYSPRAAGGVTYAEAIDDSLLPQELIRLFLPGVKSPQGIPFGSRGASELLFIGVIPLFFLIISLRDRRPVPRFFLGLAFVALSLALFRSIPFKFLHDHTFVSMFRSPARLVLLATFCFSILSAFGVDALRARVPDANLKRWTGRARGIFLWTVMALAALVAALNIIFLFFERHVASFLKWFFERFLYHVYQPAGAYPPSHYFGIIDRVFLDLRQYLSFSNPLLLASFMSLAIGGGAIYLYSRTPLVRRQSVVLLIVAALSAGAVGMFNYPTIKSGAYEKRPATISFLENHPGRVLQHLYSSNEEGIMEERKLTLEDRLIYRQAVLVPNQFLHYDIQSSLAADALVPHAANRLMSFVAVVPVFTGLTENPFRVPDRTKEEVLIMRKALLDFLGIRYIVTTTPFEEGVFPQVFQTEITEHKIPVFIYENPEANDIFYFADRLTFLDAEDAEVFERYRTDFSQMLVQCTADERYEKSCSSGERTFDGEHVVEIEKHQNGLAALKVYTKTPGFLVFSENNLPGWDASLDGVPLPIYRVNTVFMGVAIPRGKHELVFSYSNPCGTLAKALRCAREIAGL